MKRTGQIEVVLNHMKEHGSITSMEAFEYGITRLAAVVFNLRKRGFNVDTVDCLAKNRYGATIRYAKYVLVED